MNRREVVEGLLLGSAAGIAMMSRTAASASGGPPSALTDGHRIVIVDTRFAATRSYLRHFPHPHRTVHRISGDVSRVWHDLADSQWHSNAVALHGLTTARSFFCLEQLVADRYWRRIAHMPQGPLVHWVLAPRSVFA